MKIRRKSHSLGLVAVLLWYLNSYLETKGSLEVVCGFIAREATRLGMMHGA
jgi:hypothetical protein